MANHEGWPSSEGTARATRTFVPISDFEARMVRLLAAGHDLPAIARELGVEEDVARRTMDRVGKRVAGGMKTRHGR